MMAKSHDGSLAFNIRLTTVRVVCQNTLAMAMKEHIGREFRRAHNLPFARLSAAAQDFFSQTLRELDSVAESFTRLSERQCEDEKFQEILTALLPEPKQPRNASRNPGLNRAWEKRVEAVKAAKAEITELRESGRGMDLRGSRGTYWGVLNAVLEYVDHYKETKQERIAYALLGDGADLKTRAFRLVNEKMAKAA